MKKFLKNLLIEQEEEYVVQEEFCPEEVEFVDAELEEVNRDTLIEDIYEQNKIEDKSQSIFKVEEIMNSLPKEMPTATKQATVKSIMGSFGLTEEMVIHDGEYRIAIMASVANLIKDTGEGEVTAKRMEIEEHKKEIERLEKEISEEETNMKVSKEKIDAETERIDGLMKFIYGGE